MRRIFTPGYVLYLALLVVGAGFAYRALAPRFRPLTIADLARPDVPDSPERLIRKIDRDGLLHDLRPHAVATHDGISYATNGDGLRDDHEYAVEKSPGVRRVIVLGDSFVFGWGLHLEHTLPKQLATLMDPSAWEFLNLGVPAYNTESEVRFLEERGLKYHPDVVVLVYHPNDAGVPVDTPLGDGQATLEAIVDFYGGGGSAEERAKVADFLRAQDAPLEPDWNVPVETARDRTYLVTHFLPLYWHRMQATLDHLAELARTNGFTVDVAIMPELDRPWEHHPFAPLYRHVADEMRRHGFGVIELYPVLEHYPNTDLMLWGYDGHTSAFANRIVAHVIASALDPH